MSNPAEVKLCSWQREDGSTCRARAQKDSDRCRWHPHESAEDAELRRFQVTLGLVMGEHSPLMPDGISELASEPPAPDILTISWPGMSAELSSTEGDAIIRNTTATLTRRISVLFHAVGPNSIGFVTRSGDPVLFDPGHIGDGDQPSEGKLPESTVARLRARNALLKFPLPEVFKPALDTSSEELPATQNPRQRQCRTKAEPLPAILPFPSDRILLGVVEGLSQVHRWQATDTFYRSHSSAGPPSKRKDFRMSFGFKADPGEATWKFLLAHGEAAIKAHFALHARCFLETDGVPGRWAHMNISQFCQDLGYKKHPKGGFDKARKQEAIKLLEVLTSAEIVVHFTPSGKNQPERRLRGPLWTRGIIAEEQDQYSDLLGQAREGDPALWDPVGFTFGPGPWFADPTWREQNKYLGLIGAGLMQLQPDNDQAAIRIGGYLGTLARVEQYRVRRIRIRTLLDRIGYADRYKNNAGRLQERIEEGFDKLVKVGVFAAWRYTDALPDDEEPDMDSPEELAQLANCQQVPWRFKRVEVEWPESLTRETARLEKAQEKAVAEERRRVDALRRKASASDASARSTTDEAS